ncbi:nuclear transport factor 2 family protein [Rhizobium sp. G21]|uniref:nuclear transport factor 2 family protein n=1 Tax=Rhizobium sp. G21 TaxID=2758439 RepID=UPI001FEE1246|nr:nuclear transport factor 2 family protein [Rhizobium sp. G21]
MHIDELMQDNLDLVFGERDATRRLAAIRRIYDADAELHEPHRSARGHQAICDAVGDLLAHLPADFGFTAIRPASGHNGLGRLQWRAGPPGGPPAATGVDVAHVEGGLIRALHVFLDQDDI